MGSTRPLWLGGAKFMSNVIPIHPNKVIPLHAQDILELVNQVKWAYITTTQHAPSFLVIGGNYWLQLQARLRRVEKYAGIADLAGAVQQIQGMTLVIVKRDALECGE